ncbi:MAG: methyltransferase [Desulfobacca sp. RBG_16_60_12]|nr:MAG: methyltransferase [Desulfobacca sp. RBG_16_60_12]
MDDQLLSEISACILSGDLTAMREKTLAALDAGFEPMGIIQHGLVPGMEKLGETFGRGEIFLPELLIGAEAMKTSLALIKPLLKSEDLKSKGTVVIGSVLGDVHDIGKNIVAWMLEGAGLNVIDLGVDVAPERFIEAIRANSPHIIALSALLTTSSHQIAKVINRIIEQGLRDDVKVMVGGAAVSQDYADQVGADGYAPDAVGAVAKARELIGIHS